MNSVLESVQATGLSVPGAETCTTRSATEATLEPKIVKEILRSKNVLAKLPGLEKVILIWPDPDTVDFSNPEDKLEDCIQLEVRDEDQLEILALAVNSIKLSQLAI